MYNAQKLGRKLAEIRRNAGLTQEDLAGNANIDRSYLSEVENGRKNVTVEMLYKLAKGLAIKPADLLP